MRITDALNLLGLEGSADLASCETAYRRAAMKYHPDRGGSADMMKAINAAVAAIRKWYAEGRDELRPHTNPSGYGDALNAALQALHGLAGLDIEICGSWVWVGGDTKPHKDALKAAGYRWGRQKAKWYFRPEGYKSRRPKGAKPWSMDQIREYHGSQAYHAPDREESRPAGKIRGAA